MLDFSVFDSILDATFVIDDGGKIVYCNDAGATFCQTSVRRVVGKALLSDLMSVAEPHVFPFTPDSQGYASPTPIIETEYTLPKAGKTGKVQVSIRQVEEKNWVFFIRDVSLEEALHSKYRSELSQKEAYARNLEKLVEARTAELNKVNQTLNAILDSLGQGFFTFDAQGECGDVFTKACEVILQGTPKQRKAWEVLGVPEQENGQFKTWMESTFNEVLPFEDLRTLGPGLFPHSNHRHVVLEYYPVRRERNLITDIVVVATDKTTEHQAQIALESERQYAAMIVKFLKNKDQFLQFLISVRGAIRQLKELSQNALGGESLNESLRILHTLEGEAGIFSLRELRQLSRDSQHILEPHKSSPTVPSESAKVYGQSLDSLHLQFERFLIENQNIFGVPEGEVVRSVELPISSIHEFRAELRREVAGDSLNQKFDELFLQVSIESRLKYFDGLIQTVAERLGKKIRPLKIEGGNLRIFAEPLAGFFSNLVHAFRNAVDHGLEEPTEREWAGKDPAGQIQVKVTSQPNGFLLTIVDDGKGIDPELIRQKLASKFPDRDLSKLNDEEIIQAVTWPGFSSRDSVGEFSGRGVGLDALREEVLSIGGSLHLRSKVGEGTCLELFVPTPASTQDLRRSA